MNDKENEEEERQKGESIKVVLIGSSGVGKSCICQKYVNNKFSDSDGSTVGASYFQKFLEIDGKNLQLDIWDTAGQEKYRSMGKMFYKDAYIVLFIYDITDKKSFEDLKNIWYDELTTSGEKNAIFAVVGNKSDLYLNEQVNEDDARKWAQEIGAIYGLVSAKNGDCIDSLFENVAKKYLSPDYVAVVNKQRIIRKEKNLIEVREPKEKKKKLFC